MGVVVGVEVGVVAVVVQLVLHITSSLVSQQEKADTTWNDVELNQREYRLANEQDRQCCASLEKRREVCVNYMLIHLYISAVTPLTSYTSIHSVSLPTRYNLTPWVMVRCHRLRE